MICKSKQLTTLAKVTLTLKVKGQGHSANTPKIMIFHKLSASGNYFDMYSNISGTNMILTFKVKVLKSATLAKYWSLEVDFDMYIHIINHGKQNFNLIFKVKGTRKIIVWL